MAGIANRQAAVVADNIRALITGTGELTSYEPFPPMIAIPLGPRAEPAFSATASRRRHDRRPQGPPHGHRQLAALFDTAPPVAA